MATPKYNEGYIDFHIPGIESPCKTWYRVYGDLKSENIPVVALHGGPGFSSDYMSCLRDLTASYSIPVVIYDQLGIGQSSHIPEKKGDAAFWTCELFLDELDNVLAHLGIKDAYDMIGQSWGGMLAAMHAIKKPKGLRKLVLSNALSDIPLFSKGVTKYREALPQDVQDILKKHEDAGTTDSEEYEKAVDVFLAKHIIRMKDLPEEFLASVEAYKADKNVYSTM
jgi:L-proline amide hydrolase